MLSKKYKLDAREVELVMTKGKFVTTDLFLLKFLKLPVKTAKNPTTHARISVIAPKKPFNTAVLRNSIRRRVYPALRPVFEKTLDFFVKTDNVVSKNEILICLVCNKGVKDTSLVEISAGIEQVFKKGGIIA